MKNSGVTSQAPCPERFQSCQAVVVFSNQNAVSWLRYLSRGFRHCFVMVEADCGWIVVDPLSNVMKANIIAAIPSGELADWYRSRGFRVIVTHVREPLLKPAPWAIFTCVEVVKRFLGIQSRWVITPLNLWNFLNSENNP